MPTAKGQIITISGAILMLLMSFSTASEIGQLKREKLTKLSCKMKFDKKDNRVSVTSGPVYFKTDGGNPQEVSRAFLLANRSRYGFDSSLSDIHFTGIDNWVGGTTVFFRQLIDSIPVYQSNSSITINKDSVITWANIFYRPSGNAKKGTLNSMGSDITNFKKAERIARDYLDIKGKVYNDIKPVLQWFDHQEKGMVLTWKVCITTDDPDGAWTLFIDTENGEVLQAADCRIFASGEGMVFHPDSLKNGNVFYGTDNVDHAKADMHIGAAKVAEKILHDYGHAFEHNIGIEITAEAVSGESNIVWEGYSTYWKISNRVVDTVMDRFLARPAGKSNHRVLSADLRYPGSIKKDADIYHASNIFSNALMHICHAIGKRTTDTLFFQSIRQLPSAPTATQAAMTFLDAEYNIYHGQYRIPILKSLDDYGLIQYVDKIPYDDIDSLGYYDSRSDRFILRSADWPLPDIMNRDNEYFLVLSHAASLDISTCNPATNFNTKIAVFRRNEQNPLYYNDDVGCSDNPTSSTIKEVNLLPGEYYMVVGANDTQISKNQADKYGLLIDFSRSLEVYTADRGYNQNKVIKPAFHIVNTGIEPVKDPIVRYYFTVEDNKVPSIDDYYTPLCTPYLENCGNGLYCIRIVFTDVTINPDQRFPEYSEIQVGAHYLDWSDWDRSNDFSQSGSGMGLNNKVAVFNKADYQIYGQIPNAQSLMNIR